ncbi:MAG TPA: prolyl oligopeptidase family serine peptidase [Terriglobia bacterium]|nr:prolyl oligopeptidase family serine peptidase [Terriglobia bacterium]
MGNVEKQKTSSCDSLSLLCVSVPLCLISSHVLSKPMNHKPVVLPPRLMQGILIVLLFTFAKGAALGQSTPEEVIFPSGKLELHGFLWKPAGDGPFPAVLWNHGSEKLPGSQPTLAGFYTAHSYVFFVPHRRGQGRSPGDYIQDQIERAPGNERAQLMVALQEAEVSDVVAALDYLKSRPFVDSARVAISGCSYGGIQTLLAGERDLGVKALVPFAPGAMSWERNPWLQERLRHAVDHAEAPVFLIQAQNDYSLEPSRVLSQEANKKHKDFQSKIYPALGSTHQEGHWRFCSTATDVWGDDVLAFLAAQMKTNIKSEIRN